MLSVITNIYNKKTKGPTLMQLFTATGKPIIFTTRDVRCVHHGWHGTHRYDIQVLATNASTCVHPYSSLLQWSVPLGQRGHVAMVGRTTFHHCHMTFILQPMAFYCSNAEIIRKKVTEHVMRVSKGAWMPYLNGKQMLKEKKRIYFICTLKTRVGWWVDVCTAEMSVKINTVLHAQWSLSIYPILTGTKVTW
jgi:hypothetical protein